jgi:hypothetical protein
MKKVILSALALLLIMAGYSRASAQGASISADDTRASLDISKNIIKLISALAKDFSDVKGDLITKTDDGTSVYGVNSMDAMMADNQYVMIKSGGAAYYIANYTGDAKKLTMSFAAFTGGVTTLTNADGNFVITQDKEKSTDEKLVYIMSVKGTKVGSYTMEAKKTEGTLIIGFL